MSSSTSARSTIGDVADAAGVSRATVSRVMNGQATVNAELARRVRQVAAELQYRPSNVARSLSLGRTQTIAVVVPDLGNPMFQGIIRGLTEAAALEGYRVMVTETDEDPTAEATMARDARGRCDAVVLVSPSSPDAVVSGLLAELQPAVVLGRRVDGSAPGLAIDFAAGVEVLVEHLTGLGHRDFVFLNGPANSPGNLARLVGFARVEAAQPQLRIAHLNCGSRLENGYAAAERVLAGQASAVIAYNDLVAFGLLARLNETGVAVPQDVSVVGFDDITLAGYAVPPLTTLAVPEAELGARGWEHLRAAIMGEDAPPDEPFTPSLVVRSSTGPVPPRRSTRRRVQPKTITTLDWHRDGAADVLIGDGLPLLRYERGDQLSRVHSPRPYAHPIYTLAGVPQTAAGPRDHRHQYGLSVAIPDVNGTTYWGGRTFQRDVGPTLLANHGRQRVDSRSEPAERDDPGSAVLHERLTWEDEYGDTWLTEDRTVTGQLQPSVSGWQLRWDSLLHADRTEITFASPATNGRLGAGYGGIFWRFAGQAVAAVLTEDGDGEAAVHGQVTPWVAIVQGTPRDRTTVILRQRGSEMLPWFCRASDYTGMGPAVAWDRERVLPYGETLELGLDAVLLDRELGRAEVTEILAQLSPT